MSPHLVARRVSVAIAVALLVLCALFAFPALIIAILAYQRTGGTADLKRAMDSTPSSLDLKKQVDSLAAMTDALREKTAKASRLKKRSPRSVSGKRA